MLPMRSMVLSKSYPWNMSWWKWRLAAASCMTSGCTRRMYSAAETR